MADGSTAPGKKGPRPLDPVREAKAVESLRESLRQVGAEDDEELLLDTIEGETSLFEVIDALILHRVETLAMAEGVGRAIDDLRARKDRLEKRADAHKAVIEQALMIAEIEKVERPCATLSLAKRPPKLVITEEADIPADFWKPGDPKLDKKALADALKDGAKVPGAVLSNGGQSLTIRVK